MTLHYIFYYYDKNSIIDNKIIKVLRYIILNDITIFVIMSEIIKRA